MTKFKSLITAVLITVLSASLLAGCGGGNGESKATSDEATAQIKKSPVVSCFGTQGTYTDEAAKAFFQDAEYFHYQNNVEKIIDDVTSKKSDYAVIPVETSSGTSLQNYIDDIIKHDDLAIVGEVIHPDSLALMGIKGAKLENIKTIVSYNQAMLQTKQWREKNLPKAAENQMNNAAAAAKLVVNRKDKAYGVIASPGAAKLHGLEIIEENIQDSSVKTRYYVLGSSKLAVKDNTRAVFIVSCEAEKIAGIIVDIDKAGLDLVTFHDRSDTSQFGKYHYFIEVKSDNLSQDKIDKITDHEGVRFLGSFNTIEK